jgi:hypothetical protein
MFQRLGAVDVSLWRRVNARRRQDVGSRAEAECSEAQDAPSKRPRERDVYRLQSQPRRTAQSYERLADVFVFRDDAKAVRRTNFFFRGFVALFER